MHGSERMSVKKTWIDKTLKELQKHAERDNCYACKQLLKEPFVKIYVDGMNARVKLEVSQK